jgi:hypothetical protein
VKSICNHLYWVAASTPSNNRELMMEKWLSVANHVQNIHSHDGDLFKKRYGLSVKETSSPYEIEENF